MSQPTPHTEPSREEDTNNTDDSLDDSQDPHDVSSQSISVTNDSSPQQSSIFSQHLIPLKPLISTNISLPSWISDKSKSPTLTQLTNDLRNLWNSQHTFNVKSSRIHFFNAFVNVANSLRIKKLVSENSRLVDLISSHQSELTALSAMYHSQISIIQKLEISLQSTISALSQQNVATHDLHQAVILLSEDLSTQREKAALLQKEISQKQSQLAGWNNKRIGFDFFIDLGVALVCLALVPIVRFPSQIVSKLITFFLFKPFEFFLLRSQASHRQRDIHNPQLYMIQKSQRHQFRRTRNRFHAGLSWSFVCILLYVVFQRFQLALRAAGLYSGTGSLSRYLSMLMKLFS